VAFNLNEILERILHNVTRNCAGKKSESWDGNCYFNKRIVKYYYYFWLHGRNELPWSRLSSWSRRMSSVRSVEECVRNTRDASWILISQTRLRCRDLYQDFSLLKSVECSFWTHSKLNFSVTIITHTEAASEGATVICVCVIAQMER